MAEAVGAPEFIGHVTIVAEVRVGFRRSPRVLNSTVVAAE